jgi:hypothetical protein
MRHLPAYRPEWHCTVGRKLRSTNQSTVAHPKLQLRARDTILAFGHADFADSKRKTRRRGDH